MSTTELKQQLESSLVYEARVYVYWHRQFTQWNGKALRGCSPAEQAHTIETFNQVDKEFQNSKQRLFKLTDDLEAVLRYEQLTGATS